jgi:hypothetical protein
MKKLLIAVATSAALMFAASPVFATTITYDLEGVTATFITEPESNIYVDVTDTLTGYVTISSSGSYPDYSVILDAVDITVAGGIDPGIYQTPVAISRDVYGAYIQANSTPPGPLFGMYISYFDPSDPDASYSAGELYFTSPSVVDMSNGGETGQFVPQNLIATPIPPVGLPTIAIGICGFLIWRRRRLVPAAADGSGSSPRPEHVRM